MKTFQYAQYAAIAALTTVTIAQDDGETFRVTETTDLPSPIINTLTVGDEIGNDALFTVVELSDGSIPVTTQVYTETPLGFASATTTITVGEEIGNDALFTVVELSDGSIPVTTQVYTETPLGFVSATTTTTVGFFSATTTLSKVAEPDDGSIPTGPATNTFTVGDKIDDEVVTEVIEFSDDASIPFTTGLDTEIPPGYDSWSFTNVRLATLVTESLITQTLFSDGSIPYSTQATTAYYPVTAGETVVASDFDTIITPAVAPVSASASANTNVSGTDVAVFDGGAGKVGFAGAVLAAVVGVVALAML